MPQLVSLDLARLCSTRVLRAQRCNVVEDTRLAQHLRYLRRECARSRRDADVTARAAVTTMDHVVRNSGRSPLGLPPWTPPPSRERPLEVNDFEFGERVVSRRFGRVRRRHGPLTTSSLDVTPVTVRLPHTWSDEATSLTVPAHVSRVPARSQSATPPSHSPPPRQYSVRQYSTSPRPSGLTPRPWLQRTPRPWLQRTPRGLLRSQSPPTSRDLSRSQSRQRDRTQSLHVVAVIHRSPLRMRRTPSATAISAN